MSALFDLLLPRECAGCGCAATLLCPDCAAAAERSTAVTESSVAGLSVFSAAPYADVVRGLLIAHKERGQAPLARPLGALLAVALSYLVARTNEPVLLAPAPSAPGVDRRRGFRPLLEVAEVAARSLRSSGRPVRVANLVVSVRRRSDQVGLEDAARRLNLLGAMAARAPRSGHQVVLVDDISTSGATITEMARAARAAGIEPLGAAVIARARGSHDQTAAQGTRAQVNRVEGPGRFPGNRTSV